MTDVAPASIPSTALPATNGTLETLYLWAALALKAANGTKGAVEVSGSEASDLVQFQVFQQPDGSYRALTRVNIELDPTYLTDSTSPFWEFAQELTTGALPPNYSA